MPHLLLAVDSEASVFRSVALLVSSLGNSTARATARRHTAASTWTYHQGLLFQSILLQSDILSWQLSRKWVGFKTELLLVFLDIIINFFKTQQHMYCLLDTGYVSCDLLFLQWWMLMFLNLRKSCCQLNIIYEPVQKMLK